MILEYPMTHLKRHRLNAQRHRARRQHWNEMMERMDRGEIVNLPSSEKLRNEREFYE